MADVIPDPFKGTAEILKTKVAEEAYYDALSKPLKEASSVATDILQGLRLFTRPLSALSRFQERLFEDLEKVRNRVPVERQVEAPAEIAGPVFEKLKYLEPDDSLREVFLNLLAASIDKERQNRIHPAFPKILDQLSRDEALLLRSISVWGGPSFHGFTIDIRWHGISWDGDRINVKIGHSQHLPEKEMAFPERLYAYLKHLEALNLISLSGVIGVGVKHDEECEPIPNSFAMPYKETVLVLTTPFGRMLTEVIFPDENEHVPQVQVSGEPSTKSTPFHTQVFHQVEIVARVLNLHIVGRDVVNQITPYFEVYVDGPESCRVVINQPTDSYAEVADAALKQLLTILNVEPFKVFSHETNANCSQIIITPRPL